MSSQKERSPSAILRKERNIVRTQLSQLYGASECRKWDVNVCKCLLLLSKKRLYLMELCYGILLN